MYPTLAHGIHDLEQDEQNMTGADDNVEVDRLQQVLDMLRTRMSIPQRVALWLCANLPESRFTGPLLAFALGAKKYHEDK